MTSDTMTGLLPFEGGGSFPVQYELEHGGHHYYVRYRHSWLTVDVDDEEVVSLQLAPQDDDDGEWSDEATHVYLHLLSDAIRGASLESVTLPTKSELASHPLFKKGPIPRYHILVCGMAHPHGLECYSQESYAACELDAQGRPSRSG
ncbi:hypothetical protein [Archangium violaceum]|uniref:hypothetical protein n=1 Tax=Archangium violaceum TaxID=83451 RepID=UPI0036DEFB50